MRRETPPVGRSWATPLAIGLAIGVAVLGCKQAPAPAESEVAVAAEPAAADPTPPEPSRLQASSFKEDSFVLAMKPSGTYEAGKKGVVEIVLDAKGAYKCNDKYPYKFKAKESPGVTYAKKVVKKEAVKLEGKRAVMKVAFTPESAGKKKVTGQFSFSVCTEERCLVERRDLALDVTVN